jgi:hypothetical protein
MCKLVCTLVALFTGVRRRESRKRAWYTRAQGEIAGVRGIITMGLTVHEGNEMGDDCDERKYKALSYSLHTSPTISSSRTLLDHFSRLHASIQNALLCYHFLRCCSHGSRRCRTRYGRSKARWCIRLCRQQVLRARLQPRDPYLRGSNLWQR